VRKTRPASVGLTVHLITYAIIVPFLGGFTIAFAKSLVENNLPFISAIGPSIVAGMASLFFYCIPGAIAGLLTSWTVATPNLRILFNSLGMVGLTLFATVGSSFFDGYRSMMFTLAIFFGVFLSIAINQVGETSSLIGR